VIYASYASGHTDRHTDMLVAILCTPNRGESEVLSGALYNTRELARPNVTRQLSGGCLHVIKFD